LYYPPPKGHVPLSKIKLNTGATIFPNLNDHGRARVFDEEDAEELERRGWTRDAADKRAKALADDLLQKGMLAQLRKRDAHSVGGASAHPRTEFGTVDTPLGRVVVAHDQDADVLMVHGVNILLTDIDRDLRQSLVATSAAFNVAFSAEEQTSQRRIIGLIVSEVMRQNAFLQAEVKRRLTAQRYD
jgi:hypothetical protein